MAERNESREGVSETKVEVNAVVKDIAKQTISRNSRSRQLLEKIRNYPFMNGLRLTRGLFKKSREKISRREGLIGV